MKNAIIAATIAVLLCAAAQAGATTFTEWDNMTPKQQSDFMADRAYKIHQWLVKNEPAKAKCMALKFTAKPDEEVPRAMIDLNLEINGVPVEERGQRRFESLMVGFVDRLCAAPEQAAR